MPLDHYVSQVHLKNFYSPVLGNRMYSIRKSDLKAFTPDSKSVCRIEDGSTNSYLREDRAVEDFLRNIEPKYNAALEKIAADKVDVDCVYTIAGFVAYVFACSPAGMRIQSGPLKSNVEDAAAVLDANGMLPSSPSALGGATLTELIASGAVNVTIDPKYPQAIGISSIEAMTARFGNFEWEVLHNESNDSPFFTSDFPIAIERTKDARVFNKIVPLSPNLALRIKPDITADLRRADFTFANLRLRSRKVRHSELLQVNRLLVRCAEDTVFYRDDRPWIQPFIAKNRHYHIEPVTQTMAINSGTMLISTLKVTAKPVLAVEK